jgi:hypothetical protein
MDEHTSTSVAFADALIASFLWLHDVEVEMRARGEA